MTLSKKLIVATSGGIDSLALSLMLKEQGADFISVIVDHKYRENSSAEALAVKKLLRKHGIDSVILTYKGKKPEKNIEEELRNIRYSLLFDYAKKNKVNKIFTAHHLDDNIETFLMRLSRGSGVKGLAVMQSETSFGDIKIIRPLLGVSKLELKEYLQKRKVKWFEDETNKDTKLTRNNLRKILSELSDYEILKKNLSRTIESISEVSAYIELQVEKELNNLFEIFSNPSLQAYAKQSIFTRVTHNDARCIINHYSCNYSEFVKLHKLIAINILYKIFEQLKFNDKDLRYDEVENAYNNIISGKKSFTVYGVEYLSVEKKIYFFKEFSRIKEVRFTNGKNKFILKPLGYEGLKKITDKQVHKFPKKISRTIMCVTPL
ncbi:MAG TPA: tRNA lysidine(34) synthetase TilS [Alphaproteobacteria bacterium]|nr:tRNA lysidine(34) synthetase TilS [Alphaproteobacteria bacterium]